MTEEARAELRRGIEGLVRAAGDCESSVRFVPDWPWFNARSVDPDAVAGETHKVEVRVPGYGTLSTLPPLTTAQHLALSVLLGDESVIPQALADMLLDMGHEYATAVAEKARAEEREQLSGRHRRGDPGDKRV